MTSSWNKIGWVFISVGLFVSQVVAQSAVTPYSAHDTETLNKSTATYGNLGLMLAAGMKPGWQVGVNVFFSSKWGGSISFQGFRKKAKNLPANYGMGWSIFGKEKPPKDAVKMFNLSVIRRFPPVPGKTYRYSLEGGLSYVIKGVNEFSRAARECAFIFGCSSNYRSRINWKSTAGLHLKGKLEMPFSKAVGMEISLCANVNSLQTYLGAGIDLTFGKIRWK